MVRRRTIQSHRESVADRSNREDPDDLRLRKMAQRRLVSSELEDFMRYLHSPWHIVWRNMVVGLARGLGAIFGATVIVALAIWVLKIFIAVSYTHLTLPTIYSV